MARESRGRACGAGTGRHRPGTAPRLLAEERLYGDADAPWPYLVTTWMPGVAWHYAELPTEPKLSVAADLGQQIRCVHALRPSGVATHEDWAAPKKSSLPPHLIAQIDGYLARLGPFDRVFVHLDLTAQHVFVEAGRLTGIIDWGDALVTDRHSELCQPYFDMFRCDATLFRVFLEASDWPVGKDFSHRALGLAFNRQALGLAQHNTMDVFHTLPALLPLQEIDTSEDLTAELFTV